MSAPNKTYDPVEVAALAPAEVERVTAAALDAIAGAATLDELKAARLAHAGDRAPIALANAEIGALPPAARADRDARVLIDEAVDVTLPWDRQPAGARHPVTTIAERLVDVFVGMGYEVAERAQ